MNEHFDVAIIGGGIQGAGIAQAASDAGYRTVVFEQAAELAAATSSRSSKLIHGGLRYLEQAQFSLVRESLRERTLLLQNAPQLVKLVPFYIPIYRKTRRRPLTIRAGLSLYALLGGLRHESLFRSIPRAGWQGLDGLRTEGLRAVFRYFDAQTDDAALTRAVMDSACRLGNTLLTGAEVTAVELDDSGSRIQYQTHGETSTCRAQVVINATGPWVNHLLTRVSPPPAAPAVDLIQGTHIVIDAPLHQGIYDVEAPRDGRAVFVMPWRGKTLIGTTETHYEGDPADVKPLQEEIDYLLGTYTHYFPRHAADQVHVESAFAGLRVLPRAEAHAFARPRETMYVTDRTHKPRLLSVYGGKLTGYRAAAEKALDTIRQSLPVRTLIADTRKLELFAGKAP